MNQGGRDANRQDYERSVKQKLDRVIELLERLVDDAGEPTPQISEWLRPDTDYR